MLPRYTEEQHAWLTEKYPKHSNREIVQMWPWTERPVTVAMVNNYGSQHHLKKLNRSACMARKYTQEQNEFMREYIPGHNEHEIIEEFERRFGIRLTESKVANFKVRLGVKSGTNGGQFRRGLVPANKGKKWDEYMSKEAQEHSRKTQFKKGCLSGIAKNRKKPLLSIREGKDGYMQIKVAPRNRGGKNHYMGNWISLAQFEWMKANGRDWPDGCRAVFADHDTTNLDPDNIVPVPMDVYVIVTGKAKGHSPNWNDRATLEAAIAHAKLKRKIRKVERSMPFTCSVCGQTFYLNESERAYPTPPKSCPDCRAAGKRAPKHGRKTRYDHDEIRRLAARGVSRNEIAERMGCTTSTVDYAINGGRKARKK